jgi:hypothetical protein
MGRNDTRPLELMVLFLALAPTALASTQWYVDGVNGRDSNNCVSDLTACQTIGYAISLASSGDSIMIAPAVYTENLTVNFNLNLTGAGAATTIIDGGGTRVFAILSTSARVALSNLTIRNGIASGGGGILNWGALTVSNSTITGNIALSEASAVGGGIFNIGTLAINNSTLSGNTVTANFVYGGAIYSSGAMAINNSTLSGNSVTGRFGGGGGGIYTGGGAAKISNSTLAGNSGNAGGGIYNGGGTVTLQNSVVANSPSGGNCYGKMTSSGYNLSSDGTCSFSKTGDLNKKAPKLGPLQDNSGGTPTMALLTGSPAIDSGNPAGCTDNHGALLKTDQRGMPRPDKEDKRGCDRGAYERQSD